jgi:hypothetical protein
LKIDHKAALQNRATVLKQRIGVLQKTFDPNQPRDEEGKWSETGGGGSSSEGTKPDTHHALTLTRVQQAVESVATSYGPKAKEALAAIAASLLVQYPHGAGRGGGPEEEVVKDMLLNLGTTLKLSASQTRDQLLGIYRRMRDQRIQKVEQHKDVAQIDAAIKHLEGLDLSKIDKPKD